MRDKINVLYYPDMVADQTTLKKLFFSLMKFILWIDHPLRSTGGWEL